MSSKKESSTTDILVGIVAIIALCGIGYFLIVDGMNNTPTKTTPVIEHRIDTIKTLPLIEFKPDSL